MADIFDEVDEDLRAERAQALLRRYGGALIAAALAVICAVAAYQAWQWYQSRRAAEMANAYLAASAEADSIPAAGDPAKRDAAADAFMQVAANGPPGYHTLARLRAAGLKADAGDRKTALALWDQVAADGSADHAAARPRLAALGRSTRSTAGTPPPSRPGSGRSPSRAMPGTPSPRRPPPCSTSASARPTTPARSSGG